MISSTVFSTAVRPTKNKSTGLPKTILLSLLRLALILISSIHLVCSFQSIHRPSALSRIRITDQSSFALVPLKVSSSTTLWAKSNSTLAESTTKSKPRISKNTINWERKFDLLCAYRDREGHVNVPNKHKEEGENLGQWLTNQRTRYKTGALDENRCNKLESIGMVWEMTNFSKMFDLLCAYRDREGTVEVPRIYEEDGENLGRWLHHQCTLYRKGSLRADRLRKLESVGVAWENRISTADWEDMFDLLCIYQDREGNVNVHQKHKEDGENLGIWLMTQRTRLRKGILGVDRQRKLESIGVTWGTSLLSRWESMFDLLCNYRDREGNVDVPVKHKEDDTTLGMWLATQRTLYRAGTLRVDRRSKLESIGVTWKRPSTQWESMLALLETYKHETGHCNAPRDFKVTNSNGKQISLGSWVDRQRSSKMKGSLDDYRICKLEDIGFEWDRDASRWNEMFALLSDYKEGEGHCNVPLIYENTGSKKLGRWLGTQRQAKRKGALAESRRIRLETLGVEWDVNTGDWNEMLGLLETYKTREGHCLVPVKQIEEGKTLGIWVNNARAREKTGALGVEKCRALEDIGIVWDAKGQKWDEMVTLLVQYKEQNGNCLVPQNHKEDGKNLGTWLNTQRRLNRLGTLQSSKKQQLEELGVVWDVHQWKWDEMFTLLLNYQEREGDCMVPQYYEESGKYLGKWLDSQRQLQRKGNLDVTKEARLEAIAFVWDVPDFNQEEMMNSLLQYKEREGDCNVPVSHMEDGKSLGSWLSRQRRLRTTRNLDPLLSKELEAAGVIWSINEQKWETMFALLDNFQNREGHCRVPQNHKEGKDEKKLGAWLDYQRYKKKSGKLDVALQTRMEKIGVEWNIYAKFDDDEDWGFAGMDHLFDDENMYN